MSEIQLGKLNGVVVSKSVLLETLNDNKEKHNALYELAYDNYKTSVRGYVEQSTAALKTVADERLKYSELPEKGFAEWDGVTEFSFPLFVSEAKLPPAPRMPVSHENDYITAIRRVSFSIYDKFELSENEFQQYILNNWSWKKDFLDLAAGSGFVGNGKFIGSTYESVRSQF